MEQQCRSAGGEAVDSHGTALLEAVLVSRYAKLVPNLSILQEQWVSDRAWLVLLHVAAWAGFDGDLDGLVRLHHFSQPPALAGSIPQQPYHASRWVVLSRPCRALWWRAAAACLLPREQDPSAPRVFHALQLQLEGRVAVRTPKATSAPAAAPRPGCSGGALLTELPTEVLRQHLLPQLPPAARAAALATCRAWRQAVARAVDCIVLPAACAGTCGAEQHGSCTGADAAAVPAHLPDVYPNLTSLTLGSGGGALVGPHDVAVLARLPALAALSLGQLPVERFTLLQGLPRLRHVSVDISSQPDSALPTLCCQLDALHRLATADITLRGAAQLHPMLPSAGSPRSTDAPPAGGRADAQPPPPPWALHLRMLRPVTPAALLALRSYPNLVSLDLSTRDVREGRLDAVCMYAAAQLTALTSLQLSGRAVAGLAALAPLCRLRRLAVNDLAHSRGGSGGSMLDRELAKLLPSLSSLEALEAREDARQPCSAAAVAQLAAATRLRELDLSGWQLLDSGLCRVLRTLRGLNSLRLRGCALPRDAPLLAGCTALRTLCLADSRVSSAAERDVLLAALGQLGGLTDLDLGGCGWLRQGEKMTGAGLEVGPLVAALRGLPRLARLALDFPTGACCHFGNLDPGGFRALLPLLAPIEEVRLPWTCTLSPLNNTTHSVAWSFACAVSELVTHWPHGHPFLAGRCVMLQPAPGGTAQAARCGMWAGCAVGCTCASHGARVAPRGCGRVFDDAGRPAPLPGAAEE